MTMQEMVANHAEIMGSLREIMGSLRELGEERNALRAANATLEADQGRIDWLESQGCLSLEIWKTGVHEWWTVERVPAQANDEALGKGGTLREAIDAARNA